jgi:DNA-binding protein H-NS
LTRIRLEEALKNFRYRNSILNSQRGFSTEHDMKQFKDTLAQLSIDELWDVYRQTEAILPGKLAAKQRELEERLAKLGVAVGSFSPHTVRARRCYPKVLPKYRNPLNGSETWAGRGKQPRWVTNLLRSGKRIDDLRIDRAAT